MRLAGILLSMLAEILAAGCSGSMGLKDLPPWSSLGDPANGRTIYVTSCSRCHGVDGKGAEGNKLVPPPADLTSDAVQSRRPGRLFHLIDEGKPSTAMGEWKHTLTDDEIWDVLAYVRTLRNGNNTQP